MFILGYKIKKLLTLQCSRRCTVQTFNSSQTNGPGALYGHECF